MDRDKALDLALANIEKQFGKGSVMKMGDDVAQKIAAIPTGALSLDLALGIGGLPRGRVVELYGPESSGKTTVALHVVAEAQKLGGIAAFIDAEHALDPTYARALGVDINELLVSQPDTGEQALEITDMLVRSNAVDIVVIDSVAALTPRAEIEGDMGDTHVGLQARLMSQALRKLAGSLNRSKTCAVFINQLREKVGVMFGSPEVTPGGRALKFYSSVRLDVRRIETLKDGTDAVGNRVRVKVVKNKCVAAGTRVFDPTTGSTHRIEELAAAGEGTTVWAADKNGTFHLRPVLRWMDQGEQETVGLSLRDGAELIVTPDHRILTEHGWREAGQLQVGDRVARPRRAGGFGEDQPVPPHHARMLGYLIGGGSVGDEATIALDAEADLHADASRIADELGCDTNREYGACTSFSPRPGASNGVLELARWAGVGGDLTADRRITAALLAPDVAADVLGNLLFGIWELDGWVSREPTGGVRTGFVTTSEQLARQLQWSLLRWGVTSAVVEEQHTSRGGPAPGRRVETERSCWVVRIGGIDDVRRFAAALPMWGPRGRTLLAALDDPAVATYQESRNAYLPRTQTAPVVAYLGQAGLRPADVAAMVGDLAGDPKGGYREVLGSPRMRRDRVERLADALDSGFLRDILAEELFYDRIDAIEGRGRRPTYDLEVDELHNFVADGVVVHNCAPPFRQSEFDILYGEGISKEGSLIDVGVEEAIIRKAGAWYTYDGEQLGQGKENARQFLKEHEDVAREIEKRVKEKLGLEPIAATDAAVVTGTDDADPNSDDEDDGDQ